jgi:serine/threonine protein kinase
MRAERWREVKEIFQGALECAPNERFAFLSNACGGDEELRHEVESLIAAHQKDGSFIDSPAYPAAAEMLRIDTELKAGQDLGPYRILSALDKGGMGEVYRARDMRLGRDVAIKVLPATLSADPDRIGRFQQEACAAGALNHPNTLQLVARIRTKKRARVSNVKCLRVSRTDCRISAKGSRTEAAHTASDSR